jgi:hypothetical protein
MAGVLRHRVADYRTGRAGIKGPASGRPAVLAIMATLETG